MNKFTPKFLFIFITIFSLNCLDAINTMPFLHEGPDFLILGGVKCGTTSLFRYLKEHPNIRFPQNKELFFFNKAFEKSTYNNGIEWYLKQFPKKRPAGDFFLTGEASAGYFARADPKEISSYFPNIKLIILLRNPVDRALSHYKMSLRNRNINGHGSIEKTFTTNMINFKNTTIPLWDPYIYSGVYVSLIRSWRESYPDDQILIICSEELFATPSKVVNDVFAFLELPAFTLKEYKIFNKGSNNEITLSPSLREQMSEFFSPYNQELQTLLQDEMHIDIDLASFGWDLSGE